MREGKRFVAFLLIPVFINKIASRFSELKKN